MIDLHTHSLFSDGELLPSELIRRASVAGYKIIAITDHADISNYDFIIPRIRQVCQTVNRKSGITAIPGVELTHVDPADIKQLADKARGIGADIIIVHGETIAEPVKPGTNKSALCSDIDILAHPGLITEDEVKLAAENGIALEISSRHGHCLTNGHVARFAKSGGAKLIVNSDTHCPADLLSLKKAEMVVSGAGLNPEDFIAMLDNSRLLAETCMKR